MSIEAINEQLLRAVGVGIALFDGTTFELTFLNDVLASWFDEAQLGQSVSEVLPQLDLSALRLALDEHGTHSSEISIRKKRRAVVLALKLSRTVVEDKPIIVLESQNVTRIRELEAMLASYSTMVERNTRELKREKEQVEKLLLNLMPKAAYEEFKTFGVVAPQRFEAVSVLSLDFVDFTEAMDKLPPATFISELNEIFSSFDRIGEQFDCERLKTTGDSYMCVTGMASPRDDHADAIANAALRFMRYLRRRNESAVMPWVCRIGLGSGAVLGSVVGPEKYVYDVFGIAVHEAVAARLEADANEILAAPDMTPALGALELMQPSLPRARTSQYRALTGL